MELIFKIFGICIILLLGFTFLFMNKGIPSSVQNLESKSTTIWNFGIIFMSAITIIIYLYEG